MTRTLTYYNQNAQTFISHTQTVNLQDTQERFLSCLPPGSRILDFGCGSGRDTRYFLQQGYSVDAIDGSEELCRLASQHTGIPVRQMLFQDLDCQDTYDGIWACASILHLRVEELTDVFHRISLALHEEGILYVSFKLGKFRGERGGRYFTDFDESGFREYAEQFPELNIRDLWTTADVRPGRENEKWLNVILRKVAASIAFAN